MKKCILIIIIVLISTQFCACKEEIENDLLKELVVNTIVEDEYVKPDDEISEGPISIWGYSYKQGKVIDECIEYNPELEINYKDYGEEAYNYRGTVAWENYTNDLLQEVAAGLGPDVIYDVDPYNIYDLVKQDVFYDLNKYIENDEVFNIDDYAKEVFNIGKYNGKQLFVPIEFDVPVIGTLGRIIEEENLELDVYITWDEIKKLGEIYNGENESKYLFNSKIDFLSLVNLCGKNLIDYDFKNSMFNNEILKNLIEMNNKYYTYLPVEEAKKYNSFYSGDLEENAVIFKANVYYDKDLIDYHVDYNFKYCIYPIQGIVGGTGLRASCRSLIAINKNSSNKDGCFELIKYILGDLNQLRNCIFLPVNKKVYMNYLTYIERQNEGIDIGNFADAIRNIYENVEGGYIYDGFYCVANRIYYNNIDNMTTNEILEEIDEITLKGLEQGIEKIYN